jgi:hypothetical protein
MCFLYGTPAFYGTVVCIACSQLEKLRTNLLEIRQKLDTSEQDSGAGIGREEEKTEAKTSQEVFRRMQRQLNDCIRHHQLIIE